MIQKVTYPCMTRKYTEKKSPGNPNFHNKTFLANDGWEPYFSSMKSSSSCVSLMCMMSLAQAWPCCWASLLALVGREKKEKTQQNIRSVGGGGEKSPRHHLSRPFMELSSGGLRELAHFPISSSQPHLLSLRDPGTQCV